MKILHLTHTDIPSDNRILKEMIALSELPSARIHGIGIRHRHSGQDTRQEMRATIESLDLLSRRTKMLPRPLRHLLVAFELFARLLYRGLRLRPDVVHCHDTPVLLVGVILKRILGAKLIYDAHELESNKNGQTGLVSGLTLRMERLAWPSIDHLISVSPSILAWYRDKLGPKLSSLVLNSPLMAAKCGASAESRPRYFHRKYAIPAGVHVFLYLGLLVPGRGIERILEAFSGDGIESHVVFVGYGSLTAAIDRAASNDGRIHLHPSVPHEDVVPLSVSADFGLCIIENVSLSDYFCLPNKLFEYAFAGIPVLASAFPDIAAVVEAHGLGECCAVDTAAIIEAIRRIEKCPSCLVARNLQALSWEVQSDRLRKVYQALAA